MDELTITPDGREATLAFTVKGAEWLVSDDGGLFLPDRLEVTYEWRDCWVPSSFEVGGSDPRFKPFEYRRMFRWDLEGMPQWVQDFVATIDPAAHLAPVKEAG